jgi:hypothetical protein
VVYISPNFLWSLRDTLSETCPFMNFLEVNHLFTIRTALTSHKTRDLPGLLMQDSVWISGQVNYGQTANLFKLTRDKNGSTRLCRWMHTYSIAEIKVGLSLQNFTCNKLLNKLKLTLLPVS